MRDSLILMTMFRAIALQSLLFRCDYASMYEVFSVRPYGRPSVPRSVPCRFLTTKHAVFEGEKFVNDNGAMSDDEVVASDVTPLYLLSYMVLVEKSTFE